MFPGKKVDTSVIPGVINLELFSRTKGVLIPIRACNRCDTHFDRRGDTSGVTSDTPDVDQHLLGSVP